MRKSYGITGCLSSVNYKPIWITNSKKYNSIPLQYASTLTDTAELAEWTFEFCSQLRFENFLIQQTCRNKAVRNAL